MVTLISKILAVHLYRNKEDRVVEKDDPLQARTTSNTEEPEADATRADNEESRYVGAL